MDSAIILYSLFGPFLLWPVEYFLPYPYIVEELFKLAVIHYNRSVSAKYFIFAGIAFAATETILYAVNINTVGGIELMLVRFVFTSILHSVTFYLIYLFYQRGKGFGSVGFVLAAIIHYFYNAMVPSFFNL